MSTKAMCIIMLILNLTAAILFGVCAVRCTDVLNEILCTMCAVLNGIIAGLDIGKIIIEVANK